MSLRPPAPAAVGTPKLTSRSRLPQPIEPRVVIGHVHLTVADLERTLGFCHDVLNFEVAQRYGQEVGIAFMEVYAKA